MEKIIQFEDREQLYCSIVDDLKLQKEDEVYYPHTMGNYIVTFSARNFLIRYSMDRSQLFVSIASNSHPTDWLDLTFIKNFINNADEINPGNQRFDLEFVMGLNEFLKNNFNTIALLLNKDNYQNTFSNIRTLLKNEFIRKHPGAVKDR